MFSCISFLFVKRNMEIVLYSKFSVFQGVSLGNIPVPVRNFLGIEGPGALPLPPLLPQPPVMGTWTREGASKEE